MGRVGVRIGIGIVAAALLSAGCSGGGGGGSRGGGGGGSVPPGGTTSQPMLPLAGMWLRGDLHVHTHHSHDADDYGDDIATTIQLAESAGLDFISIADHRHTMCLSDPQFLNAQTGLVLLAGEEWGGAGHAGAHNLWRDPIAHTQSGPAAAQNAFIDSVIDDIHAQGGFFTIHHPMLPKNLWLYDIQKFDAIEVWNGSWAWRATKDTTLGDIQDWLQDRGFTQAGVDAPPQAYAAVAHTGGGSNYQALKLYEAYLDAGRHIAVVGGGDRHYLVLPGMPTTYVYATNRTPAGIAEAVRAGRTYVSRGTDGPQVDFSADRDGDGIFESLIGDSIPLTAGRVVNFKIEVRDADGGKVNLIKNGQVVQSWAIAGPQFIATFADLPNARSWYRLDVYEPLDMSFPNADFAKYLILGVPLQQLGWLGSTILGWLASVQDLVATGGPLAVYMVFFGHQAGIQQSPVLSKYPTFVFPEPFSRLLNMDLHDDDYARGAVTSPIWVE